MLDFLLGVLARMGVNVTLCIIIILVAVSWNSILF